MSRGSIDRKKKWEGEFQVEMRICANPRDKKDHGIEVLATISVFRRVFFSHDSWEGGRGRKRAGRVQGVVC